MTNNLNICNVFNNDPPEKMQIEQEMEKNKQKPIAQRQCFGKWTETSRNHIVYPAIARNAENWISGTIS